MSKWQVIFLFIIYQLSTMKPCSNVTVSFFPELDNVI